MIRKTTTAIALAAALAAAAGPGTAHAAKPNANGLKTAFFKVTVDGVQTTTWKTDHKGKGGCDQDAWGNGTEKVRFTSRPTTVRALDAGGPQRSLADHPAFDRGRQARAARQGHPSGRAGQRSGRPVWRHGRRGHRRVTAEASPSVA